jgi:hypothetical protein
VSPPLKPGKGQTTFGTVKGAGKGGKLSPLEWASIMLMVGFPPDPRVIGEGLGTINAESGFNASSKVPGNEHMGAWAESSTFGSEADRLDPVKSTEAAYREWASQQKARKSKYGNFYAAWGRWEKEQSGTDGATNWMQYKGVASQAINGINLGQIGTKKNFSGVPGLEQAEELATGGVEGIESAEQFLQRMAETILDFRALGNLAAQAFAWFLKLIAKAIWDYVIAPVIHWSERAVSFYWVNFFGTGTEQGSGFGYQLRNNAGAVTIFFWSMGYAILWSDGSSASPVPAHESLFGQGVKQVEGAIARRNLTKPKDVKKKTPAKPKPKETKVPIERRQTFSVGRKRPVSVHSEGRNRASNQGFKPRPIPRPTQGKGQEQRQRLVLPPGVKPEQTQTQRPPERPAKPSRPRVGPRDTGNSRA